MLKYPARAQNGQILRLERPGGPPQKVQHMPWGFWHPTEQTQPLDPTLPELPPRLPEPAPGTEYEWRREKAEKQYKASMPSMAPGPFDPPIYEWRLFVRFRQGG